MDALGPNRLFHEVYDAVEHASTQEETANGRESHALQDEVTAR
jgi:hypothetical protein